MIAQSKTKSSDCQSQVLTALRLFTDLDAGCVEMRCIMHDKSILRGFYDDLEAFEADALALDREETAKGIYFTLNPVKRELLLRSRNKLSRGISTKDEDVVRRRWFVFDFDPVRKKDTNATDAEQAQALDRAREVRKFLSELEWAEPILGDSGNGAHLGYRVDLPNDEPSRKLNKDVLKVIADHYSDNLVNVDLSVSNAARIWKQYGTTARKDTHTDERPQRLAQILDCPDKLNIITAEQLQALLPEPQPKDERASDNAAQKNSGGFAELKAQLRIILESYQTKDAGGYLYAPGRCHGTTGGTAVWMRKDNNSVGCFKGCSIGNILTAHGLPAFPPPTKIHFDTEEQNDSPGESNNSSDNTFTEDNESLHCSDMGNGYRFARGHRLNVRYNYPSKKWYVFDGRRWLEDNTGEVYRLAKQTAINILIEAAHTPDEDRRKSLAKWASVSEGDSKLRAMLHQAESELPIKLEVFDADPMLFNCANGTIDLRTGQLRPHRREDMLTKLSPVTYDAEAQPVRWLAFLDRIFEGDEQLIKFIQKSIGYSLTGNTSEQCLFICHGVGANGKSVLMRTISAILADYGQQIRTETLMVKSYQTVNNDIAALRGARFVSAIETDDGQKLAESIVKQLTGGDAVRARFLFQESFEFTPQFKIWLAANHRPEVKENGHAIWRRIRLVPFNVIIPKAEQNLEFFECELQDELPGILAWAVEGCRLWQREGLNEPEAVTKATAEYREEMDVLADFLSERCVTGENYQATTTELYNAYETWCLDNGEKAESARWLNGQLRNRGFEPGRSRSSRFWKGIGLVRSDSDKKSH